MIGKQLVDNIIFINVLMNSKSFENAILLRMNIDLKPYQGKDNLSLQDVNILERNLNSMKKHIGFKPIYNLYKKRKIQINQLLTNKFYKFHNKPLEIHKNKYYNKNHQLRNAEGLDPYNYNIVTEHLLNNKTDIRVSSKLHATGDIITFPHNEDPIVVNANHKMQHVPYVDNRRGWPKDFHNLKLLYRHVNDIEKKLSKINPFDPTYPFKIIRIRHDDKLITKLFGNSFPTKYRVFLEFTSSPRDGDEVFLNIVKFTSSDEKKYHRLRIHIGYKDHKFYHLRPLNVTSIEDMFKRLKRLKTNPDKVKYIQLNKIEKEFVLLEFPHLNIDPILNFSGQGTEKIQNYYFSRYLFQKQNRNKYKSIIPIFENEHKNILGSSTAHIMNIKPKLQNFMYSRKNYENLSNELQAKYPKWLNKNQLNNKNYPKNINGTPDAYGRPLPNLKYKSIYYRPNNQFNREELKYFGLHPEANANR